MQSAKTNILSTLWNLLHFSFLIHLYAMCLQLVNHHIISFFSGSTLCYLLRFFFPYALCECAANFRSRSTMYIWTLNKLPGILIAYSLCRDDFFHSAVWNMLRLFFSGAITLFEQSIVTVQDWHCEICCAFSLLLFIIRAQYLLFWQGLWNTSSSLILHTYLSTLHAG